MSPRSVRPAAPTRSPEYGAYASAPTSWAAVRRASQSTVTGLLDLALAPRPGDVGRRSQPLGGDGEDDQGDDVGGHLDELDRDVVAGEVPPGDQPPDDAGQHGGPGPTSPQQVGGSEPGQDGDEQQGGVHGG